MVQVVTLAASMVILLASVPMAALEVEAVEVVDAVVLAVAVMEVMVVAAVEVATRVRLDMLCCRGAENIVALFINPS